MSGAYLALRTVIAIFLAAAVVYAIYEQDERERSAALEPEDNNNRYRAYLPPMLYPLFIGLLLLMILLFWQVGGADVLTQALAIGFEVFFAATVYYALLLMLLPWLRRRISARLCAALWALPNFLYLAHMDYMALDRPLAVVRLNERFLLPVLTVWAAGFFAVLAWKIGGHLVFRFSLLRHAEQIVDPHYTTLWREEQVRAGIKKANIPLLRSDTLTTPLSIGLFRPAVRLVLPARHYTPAQLRLIYRHELVHIGREDSGTKFFMTLVAALCWFNPLMWLALRRSAEDLELGCDETVLLDADEATRRQYADLLLSTAGDDRGFSTCLSASAKALRYRLKNVMNPTERHLGAWVSCMALLLLFLGFGQIAFAYEEVSPKEVLFSGLGAEEVDVDYFANFTGGIAFYDCADDAAVYDYLSSLELHRITGNYKYPAVGDDKIIVTYNAGGTTSVTLTDHAVSVVYLYGRNRHQSESFYCADEIDFAFLRSLHVARSEG